MKIILASASPRRAQVLSDAGIHFTALPTETDETRLPGEAVADMVRRLAHAKAQAAAKTLSGKPLAPGATHMEEAVTIIGADTVVEIDGEALGKPGTGEAARAMLNRLSGKIHHVHTGVAMIQMPDGLTRVESERTKVHFAALTPAEIAAYAATGEALDKAGAYGIQGFGGLFVERIEGCYFNVVGLPLARVYRMLKELGAV